MKNSKHFPVSGEVKIFQVDNPWIYVDVPKKYTDDTKHLADRGLVAITATLGTSIWNTSLMPMGDGTQFIPLPAKVRKLENVEIGDRIKLSFVLRKR
ncbi:MAG: DUF1905 domain-containing protein [Anaerolineae bacterium]|nr:DUF1905 domain-containing protein [Anaerolineae bacterium]MCI0610455.1 DUF1905 domain-containing protein [Anaerolineae bacterium]